MHLKATISLMLTAQAQIVLFWGREFVALYNDAYAPTIGDKHPKALGRPAPLNLPGVLRHGRVPQLRNAYLYKPE